MRQQSPVRRAVETIGVGALAVGLVAAQLIGLTTERADAAAVTTVVSEGFDGSSLGALQQSGSPTLGYVDEGTGKALIVTGRAQTWYTVQSSTGIFAAGVEYTFSMRVKLIDAEADAVGRFTLYDGAYTPVGGQAVTTTDWTTISGTYTVPSGVDATTVKFAIEAGSWAGSMPGFLVDDVLVTTPATVVTVLSEGFDGSSLGALQQSGSPTLGYVDEGTGKALSVTGRAQTWYTVQSSTGIFAAGVEYTFSMRVKLIDAEADAVGRFTLYDGAYTPVGGQAVTTTDWTTISGTYTVPSGVDATTVKFAIEAGSWSGSMPGFLVDDVLVTSGSAGGGGWTPSDDPTFVPGGAVNPTTTPVAAARGAGNVAALTFDDGPDVTNTAATQQLLAFLKANGIHAVFCVIGSNIQAPGGAALLREIVADGHTLCNHSTDYNDMGSLTQAQVETKLKANLQIIREALGDPNAKVPYIRAPNGSWGQTAAVAVALGMQPLAVTNTINDWDPTTQADLTTLENNLRASIRAGQLVLAHVGGGDRTNTITAVETVVAERLTAGWTFTLPQGGPAQAQVLLSSDFEDGTLQGWAARGTDLGDPTVAVVAGGAHASAYAAEVSSRVHQGQGIQHDISGLLAPGGTYDVDFWVRFDGAAGDGLLTLSARTVLDGTATYSNLVQVTGVSTTWTKVTGTITVPSYTDAAELYLETKWASGDAGNTNTFSIDDFTVQTIADSSIQQELTPLKDTLAVPLGVAVDSRELSGTASELLLKHFDQVTSENFMKPEAWYDADGTFRENPEATALMQFAQANGLRVYGHTLVWHSQTPDWFFQHDDGTPLTSSAADQDILRQRLHDHITNVAKDLSDTYGPFGSSTNPLVAFDVVNEVVDDGTTYADGLRRSPWYTVLGESFIDLAFQYANEAFNGTYAAPGVAHPITLFINDYNTEQSGKRARLHALVERLLDRGVPVDGVGHQFHLSLSTPVDSLADALNAFTDLGVVQAITELDVTVGSDSTARLIDQGYFYRDAFRIFRAFEASATQADEPGLFSITVWGLTDGRSWRSSNNGLPLLFDDRFQAKYAYYGVADASLPATIRTANSFRADTDGDYANASDQWRRLPLISVGSAARFQTRWTPTALTVFVAVDDPTVSASDAVTVATADDASVTVMRNGTGSGTVAETATGWTAVVTLPLTAAVQGATVPLDVRVANGGTTTAWNSAGAYGTITLIEPLSFVEVVEAASAPAIDGAVDAVWADASTVRTSTFSQGTSGAQADVRTLWRGSTLYVLAEVADPIIDSTGSDPWTQDSVEIYVDGGNAKNGTYRADDTQIRIGANGAVSFGTGEEAAQTARLTKAVATTATGYRVEAAIDLLSYGGLGTFQGLDFQVNDASNGARTSIVNWADPTGAGYQSTAHWGVGELVAGAPVVPQPQLAVALSGTTVTAGGTLGVQVTGAQGGEAVQVWLNSTPVLLSSGVAAAAGTYAATVTIPASTPAGAHTVRVLTASGEVSAAITVVLADPGTGTGAGAGSGTGSGALAATGAGADPWALMVLALMLLVVGVVTAGAPVLRRRR